MVGSLVVLDIVWFPFCASGARDRERKISPLSNALLCVTVAVSLAYDLRVQFAPLHPLTEGYPSKDLWQRDGQAEPVGKVLITTGPAF